MLRLTLFSRASLFIPSTSRDDQGLLGRMDVKEAEKPEDRAAAVQYSAVSERRRDAQTQTAS